MLDEQYRHSVLLERAQQSRKLLLLAIAEAGGGLIEHQEHRIGGERARDFGDPLLAKRQASCGIERVLGEPCTLDDPRSNGARARLLDAVQSQRAANHARLAAQIRAERDVVEHAHLRNELDVLKCASDTAARDFIRLQIADRLAEKNLVADGSCLRHRKDVVRVGLMHDAQDCEVAQRL